jgi:membrane fusion protein (multidrug efflux system)
MRLTNKRDRFKSPRRWPPRNGYAFLAAVLAVVWADGLYAQPSKKKGGPPPALVRVSTVAEKEVIARITLVGTAEPWLETVLASQEAGLVRKMLVDEGDYVKKNQRLCEQDATQLKLKIEAGRAAFAEAEVLRAKAQREWERQKRLYNIQSVSEKAYEDAKFDTDAMVNKVARLKAELNALEDQLTKKRIRAPVSGYVVKRHALVGQWLGEGEPVVTLAVLDPIRVIVPVPERYISSLKKRDRAQVNFDALPGQTFEGVIAAVIPRADAAARTFPVHVEIPNPKTAIKAGMLGRATLPAGYLHKALLVPKDALVLSGMGTAVFVVNDQSARLVPVKTGAAHGSLIEVGGDLKAGLKVVIRGNERLRPGQPVQIVPNTKPAKATNRAGENPPTNPSHPSNSEHEAD